MIHHEASGKAAEKGLFSRRVSVRAHFGNRGTAEQAANAIGRHARTVHVSHASPFRPASPARREDEPSVRLLEPNWLAFGAGLAIGVAGLQLVFPGPLASVYVDIGPSTATDLIKAVFVITGLAVALGWLTRAFAGFWQRLPRPAGFDLQAEVPGQTLRDAEQALRETGAVVVWVLGDESLPAVEPED